MTQKDPSDFDPKHRIIGAVIIVSLAVIFVPMILDRPSTPPDTSSVSQIPVPASDAENKVVVTPVPPPAPKQSTPEKPIVDAEPPKPAVIAEAPKPSAPAADKPAPTKPVAKAASSAPTKPAPKPEPKAAEIKSGWVVQVGTFSNAGNAVRLETQLKKHGHAVSRERIARDGGSALRLRVGPFRDKALAQKAQGQIEKETGVKGVVLAYP